MAAINYSTGTRITNVLGHTVSAKAAWADSWTAVPNLTCVECAWNAAPAFNTALLQWETGLVIMPGDTSPTTFGTWVGRGQFIRIDWACDDGGTLTWVGFVDTSSWPTEIFGRQQLVCYGLERSLALTPIISSVWNDAGTPRRNPFPLAFNRSVPGADGLRSTDAIEGVYAFRALNDPDEKGETWSTRDIVQYLLTYNLPTNAYGIAAIPWSIDQLTQLPDWDAPVVETANRTVWDVLNELINPSHQLGFTVVSNGSTAFLRCFTHFASNLVVGSQSILANPNQHTIVFAPDAMTDAQLSDVGSTYDQVIVRGARRKSVCTLTYTDHLEDAWPEADQTAYEDAESENVDYGSWSVEEKRQRNQKARDEVFRKEVFRRFRIKSDWNFEISTQDVFPDATVAPRSLNILPQLPIRADARWSGEVDPLDYIDPLVNSDSIYSSYPRPLLAIMDDPSATDDKISLSSLEQLSEYFLSPLSANTDYSVHVTVRDRSIELTVEGGPQHLIASGTFSPLADDLDPGGGLDYTTLQLTVCIEEDRFCEGVWPASASGDVVRRMVIDLGDNYQQVYIVPDTVTHLDGLGVPVTSDGGYLRDDTASLNTIARAIALCVVNSRKRASWRSGRRISSIAVGDLITTAGGASVVAPIVEIKITAPTAINRPPSMPQQSFATFGGLFDPLATLRRVGAIL
jgi:hypothetical protein